MSGRPSHSQAFSLPIAVFATGVLIASPAIAQTAPDAGSILRDIQRATPPLSKPPAPVQPLAPEEQAPDLKPGQTVRVNDFHIRATLFPEAVLKDLVKDYIGRDCSLSDLKEAAAKIARYYRDHDYLARAYLPKQTIQGGVVEIVVLESKLGAVSVDPSSTTRLDSDIAVGRVQAQQEPGAPMRPSALEAGIASLNSLPGVAASATLVPGQAEGQTDVRLRVEDTPLVSGLVQADNASPRSVGSWRGVGSAALNDPIGLGDQETATILRSNGSEYGRIGLAAPVGPSGLSLGINASYLDFAIDREFNSSDSRGTAATVGASASYPLWRRDGLLLDTTLTYDHKRLVNQTADLTVSINQIDVGGLGVSGSMRDDLLGGGITSFGVSASFGQLDLGAVPSNLANDRISARSQGDYAKVDAVLSRLQHVAVKTDLLLALSGQWADKNLDSSEKFSLGGPSGVRAYPVNEANGDEGWLASAELRYAVLDTLHLGPFIDAGGITQHQATWTGWQGGGSQPNSYNLYGAGLAASWQPTAWIAVKATLAHTLGDNPGSAPGGYDADGYRDKTRFWLQAVVTF
jgi:hemolysin activation/secretion protein